MNRPYLNKLSSSYLKILLYFSVLFIFLPVFTQNADSTKNETLDYPLEEKAFDREKWKKLSDGLDYSEVEERKEPKPDAPNIPNFHIPGIDTFLIILFVVLIAALLIWLLKGSRFRANKKVESKFSMQEFLKSEGEDENLNLEEELQLAISNQEYVLAIRYIYLQIIVWLSQRKDIRWQKDKTNNEYYYELKSKNKSFNEFLYFTKIYEHTWFGEKEVNEQDFKSIEAKYIAYKKTIEPKTSEKEK